MPELAIVGYGKMGKLVEQFAPEYGFAVALKLDEFNNTAFEGLTAENFRGVDVAIDFSIPSAVPRNVEGIAALLFQVADTADPIQVGEETTYEVRVANQGSKAAANVQLIVDLPSEVTPIAAEGQVRNRSEGNRVTFDALASLAGGGSDLGGDFTGGGRC